MINALKRKLKSIRQRYVPDYYLFPRGYALPPVDITLQLTFACNIRCTNCYQHILRDKLYDRSKFKAPNFPSLADYKRFLDQASLLSPNIRLSGGEPLLYPHLFELADYVKELGLNLTVSTNGTLVSRYASQFAEREVDSFIFSVNGPQEIHDAVVNSPGAFQAAAEGIQSILDIRKRKKSGLPRISINMSNSNENQQHMLEMVEFAEELGVDELTFSHLWFWDDDAVASQNRDHPEFGEMFPTSTAALSGIDPQAIINNIKAIRDMDLKVAVSFYPNLSDQGIKAYYTSLSTPLGSKVCLVPWLVTYLRPNGDVAPCYLNYTVGNIKEQNFRSIWNGIAYRKLRMQMARYKLFPACRRCTGIFLFNPANTRST